MSDLSNTAFEVCHKDCSPLTGEEAKKLLAQIPEWDIKNIDGVSQLQRTYRFSNFVDAVAFANRITELAEQEDHHPSILLEWGKATLTWWTHTIKGLHQNDFVMAARSDKAYE